MTLAATLACLVGAVFAALRWLRVAQREHYGTGQVTRFALRWWWGLGFNRLLAAVIVVNVALAFWADFFAFLVAIPVAVGPFGLRIRGVAPGPVAWTRRLRTLAAVTGLLVVVVAGTFAAVGLAAAGAAVAAAAVPFLVDAALTLTDPLERRLARPWVDRAAARLREVDPLVIGITGSYGKTTTKGYVAHLVEGSRSVVATPRSFNNAAGLARSVNEHLPPGTEVFVAEMGTYGPGEIAAMCEWVRPRISAITAIGPVHLERMKTEERITEAKSEIFSTAEVAILNVDNQHLAGLAERLAADGRRVVRCSATDQAADVYAAAVAGEGTELHVAGERLGGRAPADAVATNVAVAVACALEAGVPREAIASRLGGLPTPPNRRTVAQGASGATIVDDTFNSNPAGARAALDHLERLGADATRVVVVTPGMIELGPRQAEENEAFAAAASEVATEIVIVGATNRRALEAGAHRGRARVVLVDDRAAAVAWVKDNVGAGDVVLYENDLPDHYP